MHMVHFICMNAMELYYMSSVVFIITMMIGHCEVHSTGIVVALLSVGAFDVIR